MRFLNDEQIETLLKEKKEGEKKIEENINSIDEKKKSYQSIEQENKNYQTLMEENTNKLIETSQNIRVLRTESNQLEIRNKEIEKEIEEDKRAKNIDQLIKSQPDFFDILEKRIKAAQENTSDNVSGFIQLKDPNAAVIRIKTHIDSARDFTQFAIELRSIRSNYDAKIKELCIRKVDGRTITLAEAREPQDYLDYCVGRFPILDFWQ